jgi:nucleoside 2-deoxyribosyltransferase
MNFDTNPEIIAIRETIKFAVLECGYIPILLDEQHIESDKTIPDEMIHLIRNSKFCIADFTGHKGGVYFESGFALGLGKPVIYTCSETHFDKAHFDIRQMQHIIYKDLDGFKTALVNKIKAWIQ